MAADEGDGQEGTPGDQLARPIGARVLDQFDNGVPGVPVGFAVLQGAGHLTPASALTDAAGVARVNWTLGPSAGTQQLLAASGSLGAHFAASGHSDFDIDVRFFGSPPTPEVAAAFSDAANRIRGAISGDVPDFPLQNFDVGLCGVQPADILNEIVDDVVIYATITPIDGPGKILGSAGPCLVRSSSRLSLVGVMEFDVADVNLLVATGRFPGVILHEMLHVIGVGTVWRDHGLIAGSGGADPRYTGPLASARCNALGGAPVCGTTVPVENVGGPGSIESHWRESVFDNELMTSIAEFTGVPTPFSAITIGSLEDIGYAVNYFAADPYAVPTVPQIAGRNRGAGAPGSWDEVRIPRFEAVPRAGVRPITVRELRRSTPP
jgi:hypothetical protein